MSSGVNMQTFVKVFVTIGEPIKATMRMVIKTLKKIWYLPVVTRLLGHQQVRGLTPAETAMAHSVFGQDFNLDQVRLKTARWVMKGYAVSPNGNIYFNQADWIDDFSKASLGKRSWLIHELTHVWQLQQGLKVVRGALINRRYSYLFKEGKSFFDYGIEQQARMVQDYYVQRELKRDCRAWEVCIPFLNPTKT